jgi:peroxiredoxin
MSPKTQVSLVFLVGLFTGVVLESHVLRPLTQFESAGATASTHSVGYGGAAIGTPRGSEPVPTLPDLQAENIEESSEPLVAGTPGITVDEAIYSFGDRDAGDIVEHSFTLTNRGDGTLVIDRVRTNCGCTVAELSRKSIPPGESATLGLKLNLHLQKGRQNRTAIVQSNDPSTPNLQIALVGNAVYHVTLDPLPVTFGKFEGDEPRTELLSVTADKSIESFNIVRTRTSGENVKADVEVVEPGRQFSVKITVTPQPGVADFRGWVHLITDHPGEYGVIGVPLASTLPSPNGGGGEVSADVPQGLPPHSLAAEIGDTLELKGATLEGEPADLANYEGEPTVVVFWASTCGACRNELTSLKKLYTDFHDKGFEVLGVSLDTSAERRQEFLKEAALPWPSLVAEGEDSGIPFAQRYKVRSIPSVVLIDRSGKVVAIDKRGDSLRQAVAEMIAPQTGT